MKPLVSVIIPTYNAEKTIETAIKSVKNQTLGFKNIEILIIDDNSKDNTPQILKKYSKEYKNIKCYYSKLNSGSAGNGRNIGIFMASSRYLMFLDQDDAYSPDMCEVLYNTIEDNEVNIVMCNLKTILNNQFNFYKTKEKLSLKKIDPKKNKEIFNNIFMWNKIFNREFILKNNIRCPKNSLSEDMVFCIDSYLNTDEIVYLKNFYGYLYNVRDSKNDSSTINSIDKKRYLKLLEGFYLTIELIKKSQNEKLIICLMENHFITLISLFIKLNTDYNSLISILEKLYEFNNYIDLKFKLNERWADNFNKNIKKRNFTRLIIISKIIKQIYKMKFFRKIYRRFTHKLS